MKQMTRRHAEDRPPAGGRDVCALSHGAAAHAAGTAAKLEGDVDDQVESVRSRLRAIGRGDVLFTHVVQ